MIKTGQLAIWVTRKNRIKFEVDSGKRDLLSKDMVQTKHIDGFSLSPRLAAIQEARLREHLEFTQGEQLEMDF